MKTTHPEKEEDKNWFSNLTWSSGEFLSPVLNLPLLAP
jgi:hypothetical protein